MGRDKATLPYDGVPMARRVASALEAAGCRPVVAVGGDPLQLADVRLHVVPDEAPGRGPIGGVLTALRQFPEAEAVVVTACDIPLVEASLIRSLLEGLMSTAVSGECSAVAVAFTDRREPLCGAWRPSVLPLLEAAIGQGERRIWKFLEGIPVCEVQVDPQQLRNMNRPSDLTG